MLKFSLTILVCATLAGAGIVGLSSCSKDAGGQTPRQPGSEAASDEAPIVAAASTPSIEANWPEFDECIAVVRGTKGNEGVHGVVTFKQTDKGVAITAEIGGLAPDSTHAIHIHQFGDINCDFGKCTGGHFNPSGSRHGGPQSEERHAGDLGNLKADATGKATYSYVDSVVRLKGKASILGRGITLHAGSDDFETQPTGGAGARIGTGVIGIAEKKKTEDK